jgi:hypothetical protein
MLLFVKVRAFNGYGEYYREGELREGTRIFAWACHFSHAGTWPSCGL